MFIILRFIFRLFEEILTFIQMKTIEKEFIGIIKDRVPTDKNIVSFIADIVPLGKEAIYRRLRGDCPFTFDEVTTICSKLNISLDILMGINKQKNYVFSLGATLCEDPYSEHVEMMSAMFSKMNTLVDDPGVWLYRAHKSMPEEFLYKYEHLFKLYVYIVYYQIYTADRKKMWSFAELNVPPKVFDIQKQTVANIHKFKSIIILSKRIFIEFIEIIKYFEIMELLDHDDISKIRKELHSMINDIEKCAEKGTSFDDKQMDIYICNIYFDCSYLLVRSDKFHLAAIGVYCLNYLSCGDPNINEIHYRWLKSLIRFSTLISVSDELKRKKFFEDQRIVIDRELT